MKLHDIQMGKTMLSKQSGVFVRNHARLNVHEFSGHMWHKMGLWTKTLAIALLSFGLTSGVVAGPVPDGAEPVPPQELYELYAGRTQVWPDKGGGIYFAPNMTINALGDSLSYGAGNWSVTPRGRLCVDITWRWGRGSGDRSAYEECWRHVKRGNRIYKSYDGEWLQWNGLGNERSEYLYGFPFQTKFTRLLRRYGR
jgi:hypothetical protein